MKQKLIQKEEDLVNDGLLQAKTALEELKKGKIKRFKTGCLGK